MCARRNSQPPPRSQQPMVRPRRRAHGAPRRARASGTRGSGPIRPRSGPGAGKLGAPVVPDSDDHVRVASGRAIGKRDGPHPVWLGLKPLDRGAEPDQLAQRERVGVSAQVRGHVAVVGEVAVRGRHWEARVPHAQPRDVGAQRCVGRGQPVVVFVPPEAADLRSALEALDGDAALAQRLQDGETRGASADHPHLRRCGAALGLIA